MNVYFFLMLFPSASVVVPFKFGIPDKNMLWLGVRKQHITRRILANLQHLFAKEKGGIFPVLGFSRHHKLFSVNWAAFLHKSSNTVTGVKLEMNFCQNSRDTDTFLFLKGKSFGAFASIKMMSCFAEITLQQLQWLLR